MGGRRAEKRVLKSAQFFLTVAHFLLGNNAKSFIVTDQISFSYVILRISFAYLSFSGSCSPLQAPRFITSPSAFGSIVAEGRTKILQCQALGKKKNIKYLIIPYLTHTCSYYGMYSGYPPPMYRWMKDGVFLSSDFSPEHFYKISSVGREDSGDYQCYAKNNVGTIVSEKIPVKVSCEFLLLFVV